MADTMITIGMTALIHAQVLLANAVTINSLYLTQLTTTSSAPAKAQPIRNRLITVHTVTA